MGEKKSHFISESKILATDKLNIDHYSRTRKSYEGNPSIVVRRRFSYVGSIGITMPIFLFSLPLAHY